MNVCSEFNSGIIDLLPERSETCFVIKGLFSKSECAELLDKALEEGFVSANDKYPKSYRNNERVQIDDPSLASDLFEKVRTKIPSELKIDQTNYRLCRLNERLRFCKYSGGQSFSIHQDGVFYPKAGEESVLTFLLYLNDCDEYVGGETAFFEDGSGKKMLTSYWGSAGDILVFDHRIWHSGKPVFQNNKYILRSDFVYRVSNRKRLNQTHHDGYIWSLAKLPGGKLASASRDRSIKIWNDSLSLDQVLVSHENSIFDMVVNNNDLLTVSRDGYLNLWIEENSGYELQARKDTFHGSALSVEIIGNDILTSGADGIVRRWDAKAEIQETYKIADGWVWDIECISNKEFIVCTSVGEVQKWGMFSSSACIKKICLSESIRCLASNDKFLFAGSEEGNIHQLCKNTLKLVRTWNIHMGIVRDIVLDESGLYSCGEDGRVVHIVGFLDKWNELFRHENFATSLCWLEDNLLASASYAGRIEIHQLG